MVATVSTQRERTRAPVAASKVKNLQAARPSEDEIRVRAYHLYRRRIEAGITGDETSDWVEAERELSGRRSS